MAQKRLPSLTLAALAVVSAHAFNATPPTETFQGGTFVRAEIGGDPSRALPKIEKKRR